MQMNTPASSLFNMVDPAPALLADGSVSISIQRSADMEVEPSRATTGRMFTCSAPPVAGSSSMTTQSVSETSWGELSREMEGGSASRLRLRGPGQDGATWPHRGSH